MSDDGFIDYRRPVNDAKVFNLDDLAKAQSSFRSDINDLLKEIGVPVAGSSRGQVAHIAPEAPSAEFVWQTLQVPTATLASPVTIAMTIMVSPYLHRRKLYYGFYNANVGISFDGLLISLFKSSSLFIIPHLVNKTNYDLRLDNSVNPVTTANNSLVDDEAFFIKCPPNAAFDPILPVRMKTLCDQFTFTGKFTAATNCQILLGCYSETEIGKTNRGTFL